MSDTTQNKTKSQAPRAKKPSAASKDEDLVSIVKALVKTNEKVLADNAAMREQLDDLQSIKTLLTKVVPFVNDSIKSAEAAKSEAIAAAQGILEEAKKTFVDVAAQRAEAVEILSQTRSLVTEMSQTISSVVDSAKTDIQNMSESAVKTLNVSLDRAIEGRANAEKVAAQKMERATIEMSEEIESLSRQIKTLGSQASRLAAASEIAASSAESMSSMSRDIITSSMSVASQMKLTNESLPALTHLANQISNVSEAVKSMDKVADMMSDILSVTPGSEG